MEDNRVILLALLILIISSFNVSSITGKAIDTRTAKSANSGVYSSSFSWYPEGMGDLDGNFEFTKNDCYVLAYNLQKGKGRFGLLNTYYESIADFSPVPTYEGAYGDGKITDEDVEFCYAWEKRVNGIDAGNSMLFPTSRKCTEGNKDPSFYGYRQCVNGEMIDVKCPDGYRAILQKNSQVLCVLQSLQAENYDDLGILY